MKTEKLGALCASFINRLSILHHYYRSTVNWPTTEFVVRRGQMQRSAKKIRMGCTCVYYPFVFSFVSGSRCAPYHNKLPVKNLTEVILLWVRKICLSSLIILWSDVVHKVIDNLVNLVGVDVNETWWNLTSLWVLKILQI